MKTDAQSAGPLELEQPQQNQTLAGPRSRSRSRARGSLGSVGLLFARCRVLEPRCARLILAALGYLQLLDAARIARCNIGGPRYARLLKIALLGETRRPGLARKRFVCPAANGFSRLLAAACN